MATAEFGARRRPRGFELIATRSIATLAFLEFPRFLVDLRELALDFVVASSVPHADGQVERGRNEPSFALLPPSEESEERFPDTVNHCHHYRHVPDKCSHTRMRTPKAFRGTPTGRRATTNVTPRRTRPSAS